MGLRHRERASKHVMDREKGNRVIATNEPRTEGLVRTWKGSDTGGTHLLEMAKAGRL